MWVVKVKVVKVQPGEGPSRGLLCDCKTDGSFYSTRDHLALVLGGEDSCIVFSSRQRCCQRWSIFSSSPQEIWERNQVELCFVAYCWQDDPHKSMFFIDWILRYILDTFHIGRHGYLFISPKNDQIPNSIIQCLKLIIYIGKLSRARCHARSIHSDKTKTFLMLHLSVMTRFRCRHTRSC